MKYLFLFLTMVLVAASALTTAMLPDRSSDVPVIYWVTDVNPAREEQVRLFQVWLEDNNHPACELRLDTANRDVTKQIIQGVSGVGGDIMDMWSGQGMRYFHSMGLLRDVTDWGRELGFSPEYTFPAMHPEITLDGRQYMFPCNVVVAMYWINLDTFARYGIEPPPARMDFEAFERIGKALVEAANPPGQRRTVFLCDGVDPQVLYRSLGLSMYNETLTRCTLNDPRYIRVLELQNKWTYEDRLMPTPAERASFSADTGYGGLTLQLFNSGNYAMFRMGRYALIQLREFGHLRLAVTEPPHGGFPNTSTGTRAAAMYTASEHPEYAKYFLAYLASEDYNMQVVRDADALPPNPKYTETVAFRQPLPLLPNLRELFGYQENEQHLINNFAAEFYAVTDTLDRDEMAAAQEAGRLGEFVARLPAPPRPAAMSAADYGIALERFHELYAGLIPQYQAEWGCHEMFVQAAREIAIPGVYSPFIQHQTAMRRVSDAQGGYTAGRISAAQAAAQAANDINAEIDRNLAENPALRAHYDQLWAVQERIEALKAAGEPIPAAWVHNHFLRRYYSEQGMLTDETPAVAWAD